MILLILFAVGFFVLTILPNFLVKNVINRYHKNHAEIPGNGLQLLEYLVQSYAETQFKNNKFRHPNIKVGDSNFYDPATCTLVIDKFVASNNSISAVAIATHEFSHFLQDEAKQPAFLWRQKLVLISNAMQKIARALLIISPIVGVLTKHPFFSGGILVAGMGFMTLPVAVHFVTLKVELDASFKIAMPILQGKIYGSELLAKNHLSKAKLVLKVCAYTYVAQALSNVLNLMSWFKMPFKVR